MEKLAEQYLQAHGKQLYQKNDGKICKLEIENKDKEKNSNEGKPKVFDKVHVLQLQKTWGQKF